ncbi:helix-turn-helix transcriptional regulator [Leptolyngbya sp. AN02str]|uniref:helix-turn-helix transcriptional regulator n=1 Tax=Leptolyngbya sp. AN02str TaxID=3423363 RepID=UPI003D31874F
MPRSPHRGTPPRAALHPPFPSTVLTSTDFQALVEQAQQQGEVIHQHTASMLQTNLPGVLGNGGDRFIHLRNGLTIHIRHATLWQSLRLEQEHSSVFPLTAKFYLSGSSRVKTKDVAEIESDYVEIPGCNYLYYLPNLVEVEEWQANEAIQVIMVYASADYFHAFHPDGSGLARPLQRLLEGDLSQRFHQPLGQTTASMNQVLQQILHAPYQGMTQQLYLEGKALELLALQFSQWSDDQPPKGRSRRLSADELERLHAARELLTQNLSHPPSLAEVSRYVGLSEYRLKQGFHELFGTTPFGHLHHHRMQLAQELLRNSNLSIAGVAARVGYCNPEAFSTAFRRKFGINPKAFQLSNLY